eukprot:CAMPEP_0198285884 /NCGR_PEP_ID=MMETSP1449-20131203/5131_1 /TAXON_ID=420275 /ORGANISM="Attheya septentrionalis, Strain CCMP2084" /LENGTH=408 /DNA_ID=CAMNT_0043983497 /DNA_START=150 /DNA_END=1372 /DNA_ORIENTATION=-
MVAMTVMTCAIARQCMILGFAVAILVCTTSSHVYGFSSSSSSFSTASSSSRRASSVSIISEVDNADAAMDAWYERHELWRNKGLSLLTTSRSVGGRGVFCETSVPKGDVLATIPARCIITTIAPEMTTDAIDNDNDDNDNSMDIKSADETKTAEYMERRNEYLRFWPGHLAALARRHLKDDNDLNVQDNKDEDDDKVVEWKELIDAWQGGSEAPRSVDSYSQEELQEVADMTNAPMEVVLAGIHDKYSLFQDRIPCMTGNDDDDDSNDKSLLVSALKQSTMNNDKQGDNDADSDSDGTVVEVQEHERMTRGIGEMYAMVLSRAANLGRAWNYSIGIVPFHDMINHSSPTTSNVELVPFGDVRSRSSGEAPSWLQDRDMILLSTRDMVAGEELLLTYKDDSSSTSADRV